jgi:hydrogenase maturation protease
VLDAGTSGVQVMFEARGSRELIVVDASTSGSEPGAIFEVPGQVVERSLQPALGLHGFRWEHALFSGRKIFGAAFPARVSVYLIEAATLDLGIGLSAPVQRAVERVVDLLFERTMSSPRVRIQNGSFYLDAAVYEAYFRGLDALGVLQRGGELALVALRSAGTGGSLAKIRNARGDRVIAARELMRTLNLDQPEPIEVTARWNAELEALEMPCPGRP